MRDVTVTAEEQAARIFDPQLDVLKDALFYHGTRCREIEADVKALLIVRAAFLAKEARIARGVETRLSKATEAA